MNNRLWAIVPAAGIGRRVGGSIPKQYLPLHGKAVIEWTVERLLDLPDLHEVVVVASREDEYWSSLSIANHRTVRRAPGGSERCYSVLNGLSLIEHTASIDDWVIVHDAARPCVRVRDIEKLVNRCTEQGMGGILAMPVRDTMKRAATGPVIIETLDRSSVWHALTPQCFRYGELKAALQQALSDGIEMTDEASAMEHTGIQPLLVEGHSDNIKITLPQDVQLAAYFLEQQDKADSRP